MHSFLAVIPALFLLASALPADRVVGDSIPEGYEVVNVNDTLALGPFKGMTEDEIAAIIEDTKHELLPNSRGKRNNGDCARRPGDCVVRSKDSIHSTLEYPC
jgi:hypothetical protein